jgi:uncharacterized protein (TIGR02246 family)
MTHQEDADKLQIRALVGEWMEATKRGEPDKILALMTDDVVFLVPGRPPMDKATFARQARAQAGANGPKIDGKSEIEEIIVCGDWAFTRGRLEVTMTPRDGSAANTFKGYTMTVFHKRAGSWLLARDANLLAPAAA